MILNSKIMKTIKTFIFSIILCFAFSSHAQDIIILNDGDEISAKVTEIGIDVVKYHKFENQSGPIYSINKDDVFMIRYQNGEKEVFKKSTGSAGSSDGKPITNYEKTNFSNFYYPPPNRLVLFDYRINVAQVKSQAMFYYYGFDFSEFTMVEQAKMGQDQAFRNYFPLWISRLEVDVTVDKTLPRWFAKPIIHQPSSVQPNFAKIRPQWISYYANAISIEKVEEMVANYGASISETEGVGLVIIMESFEKKTERATGIFTFFDIKTKKILWATKVWGVADGTGFTNHWAIGMLEMYKHYIDEVYKR